MNKIYAGNWMMLYIKKYIREVILILVIIVSFTIIMFFEPISQVQSYHDFADKRAFFGIPNFFDIMTNVFFSLFGLLGLNFCISRKQFNANWSWIIIGIQTTIHCSGIDFQ